MSLLGMGDWKWDVGIVGAGFLISVVVVLTILGLMKGGINVDAGLPSGISTGQSGVQAIQSYLDNPAANIGTLLQYFVIPFAIVWLLIYAVLEAGVAQLFGTNISMGLSLLFATLVLFSPVFVTIIAALNVFGATLLFAFAIMGLVIGAEITWTEWQWERMSADDKIMKEKTELENEAKKIDKELRRLKRKSQRGGLAASRKGFANEVERLTDETLAADDLENKANKVLTSIHNSRKSGKFNVGDTEEEIEDLADRKKQLSSEWDKIDRKVNRTARGSP